MAMFQDDSTDDETCCYLQLGEKLRINKGEKVATGQSGMSGKDKKQLFNQQRQKHILDEQSSSSSSLDMQNEMPFQGPTSSRCPQNKKRQNGDKPIDQLTNPKRTCLDDACERSPGVSGCRKKTTNGDIPHSRRIMDFSSKAPNSTTQDIFPDATYEDFFPMHSRRLLQPVSDDSDIEICPRQTKKLTPKKSEAQRPGLQELPTIRTQGIPLIDSASEDDFKMLPTGALKGGRQSPDPTTSKKVVSRKVKRVLDSDDSDSEDWPAGYRAHPLIFSSSDSEDSKPIARLLKKHTNIAVEKFANLSSASSERKKTGQEPNIDQTAGGSSTTNGDNLHSQTSALNRFRTCISPAYRSVKYRVPNRAPMTALERSLRMSERSEPTLPTQRKNLHRNADVRASSRPETNSAPQSNTGNITNGEASTSRTQPIFYIPGIESDTSPVSPPKLACGSSRRKLPDPSSRRVLGRSRPNRARPNLAAAYPDIFDAEDSSEVEFFTANSYSDNESNTEPLSNLLHNPPLPPTTGDCLVNVSSEDEISVVYTNCLNTDSSRTWPNQSRRGTPRTLGRRYNRGSRRHLPRRPDVSLSPDPVEQVRQVEEDERFARMLQAQFDAETDPTFNPAPRGRHLSPNPCQMNIREYSSSSDSSTPDVREEDLMALRARTRRPQRFRGHASLLAAADMMPRRPNFSMRLNIHGPRHTPWIEEWNTFNRGITLGNILSLDGSEDTYEALLGLAEMNGDVARGLQKSQINRLPTRKFAALGGASGGGAGLPHKRADLNKECQVCLNDYVNGDVLRILPCFHEFHTPCIDPWLKINHTCPVCRVVVDLEN